MEAGTMALLTLITALITALLSLVNAVGVLLVNGKVDRLAKRIEWLTGGASTLSREPCSRWSAPSQAAVA